MTKKTLLTPAIALAMASAAILPSCSKEEYNLDDIGDNIMFETSIAAPLLQPREITLVDFFDMEGLSGTFDLEPSEAQKVKEALSKGHGPSYHPDCLVENDTKLDLSKMNGSHDLKEIGDLEIEIDQTDFPKSSDFIEIDDLDDIFGNGNEINEINKLKLIVEIENKTDFKMKLSIQFAVKMFNQYIPIPGTAATTDNNSTSIEIPSRNADGTSNGLQKYSMTFYNIAQQISIADGLLITYSLEPGELNKFTIRTDDAIIMGLKAYLDATIDLSDFSSNN